MWIDVLRLQCIPVPECVYICAWTWNILGALELGAASPEERKEFLDRAVASGMTWTKSPLEGTPANINERTDG